MQNYSEDLFIYSFFLTNFAFIKIECPFLIMKKSRILHLDTTASTNDFLIRNAGQYGDDELVVAVTDFQTAGRGMGTNQWESEAGKNLLFSLLIHPAWVDATVSFLISMSEALALRDVLSEYTDGITIKWPNDIYWNDRKISGTRIDGNIKGGRIADMVIGTGINVNQHQFLSDAPNPVSLFQITGKEHDCQEILDKIIMRFQHYYDMARTECGKGDCSAIVELYNSSLFRQDGLFHRYEDKDGQFDARLLDVHPSGCMSLLRTDGTVSRYEVKEVKFLL